LSGHAVTGADDTTLLAEIDQVWADGGTDLHAGLVAGFQLASAYQEPGVISRMVLISDGGANTGETDIEVISQYAGDNGEDGIYMVGVGVGSAGSYNDELMDDVTDAGKGASVFVSTEAEAWARFSTDFVSTMAVAVRDVQVKLDLPPGFEIVKFSGEEFSTDPAEVEPQHLSPNDAMVFHQRIRTCAPELVDETTEITVSARFKDATTFESREVAQTHTFTELRRVPPCSRTSRPSRRAAVTQRTSMRRSRRRVHGSTRPTRRCPATSTWRRSARSSTRSDGAVKEPPAPAMHEGAGGVPRGAGTIGIALQRMVLDASLVPGWLGCDGDDVRARRGTYRRRGGGQLHVA
jgi:hypothetical protein